jgi:hypothetical protein
MVVSSCSLYSPCKTSLNNLNKINCMHYFDTKARDRPSILKEKTNMRMLSLAGVFRSVAPRLSLSTTK